MCDTVLLVAAKSSDLENFVESVTYMQACQKV